LSAINFVVPLKTADSKKHFWLKSMPPRLKLTFLKPKYVLLIHF